jgi:hypothetical protein
MIGRDLTLVCLHFITWRGLLFGADLVGRVGTRPIAADNLTWVSSFWEGYIRHDGFLTPLSTGSVMSMTLR